MSAHHGYSEPARQSDHRSEFHSQHASDLGKDGADVESSSASGAHLLNTTVKSISWTNITVKVTDRDTKQPRLILDNVEGIVNAGELVALMGPSGCGKTTLLNMLASRPTGAGSTDGVVLVNGTEPSRAAFRQMSCFVEQEDALIGSLNVRETLMFASRLSTSSGSLSSKERTRRVDGLLAAFGLSDQASTLIGTPIRKGISGGQKRRVGVASQLITSPKILFLDEPTSGLDSAASREVMSYLKSVAKRNNGKQHYFGPVTEVVPYYESIGLDVPVHSNPAEWLLELINVDFAEDRANAQTLLGRLQEAWTSSSRCQQLRAGLRQVESFGSTGAETLVGSGGHSERKPGQLSLVLTLLHRSFVKSHRDVVAYGIRMAMYTGLAIMMGTVWLRLEPEQSSIQPFINAIFFGSAFMSFMAVAYVPSFIEDRLQYVKEHHNGLYGATALMISNFLIGIPYLFLIAISFSAISYWLNNFQPTAHAFFVWVMWVFLDLLAAESLVVLFTSLFPSFVISLALVAFANGLWMSVNGFMVQPTILNVFYKYVFHYWDYQKYVFEGMMINEFADRSYGCGDSCQCMYVTELADQCKIAGEGVLRQYGYSTGHTGHDVGIMVAIIAGYRIAGWIALKLRT
ncbi:ATP-binding cassette sub-family G member 2 [Pyricularia oryzae Y34]|uniref:ATP-binding cassette sub-family G member 2 n=2 Tax=Pyricularia oryzae TaxID=318829 RepID=A0AA97PPD6_PYRO3|nr:ATP-binding cassette sub-family G member 2 [Pyricularia oryzae Y34]